MQCSKPAAANAAIGGMIVTARSIFVRALKHIHTAMHTSALHRMLSVNAGTGASDALALAVVSATRPTDPPPNVYCVLQNTRPAVTTAPMQLPTKASSQFNSSA